MRKKIAAGNWKMNMEWDGAIQLIQSIVESKRNPNTLTILGIPFLYLNKAISMVEGCDNIQIAAQNCHQEAKGAFTGEVSATMLRSIGVPYVILGHSERRVYFNETDDLLLKKVLIALENDLSVIFCCGEPIKIREAGNHVSYVINQIRSTISALNADQIKKINIAYEPIWAIGTGKTASSEQAQQMHFEIRNEIKNQFGHTISKNISILYGGSVKPSNANELFSKPDVDGGLVGGASLNSSDFLSIINAF